MTSLREPEAPLLDLRQVSPVSRRQAVTRAFDDLRLQESVVLISDEDPDHWRIDLEQEYAEAFGWDPLTTADGFRVRLTKLASTALPRIVGTSAEATDTTASSGSVWQLRPSRRSLDANVISLPPGDEIREHIGPALDVLIHVLSGSGLLVTELTEIELEPGQLVWLPPRSRRRITAGPDGLCYFSVHQRKQGLSISSRPGG